jgi:hypothetical protein
MDKNTISTLESEIQNYMDENNFTIYHDETIELVFKIRNSIIDTIKHDDNLYDKIKLDIISRIEDKYILPAKKQIIEDLIASKYSEFVPSRELHPLLDSYEPFKFSAYSKIKNNKKGTNDALWAIADDMRARKEEGEFETYREAYLWAERNIDKKGTHVTAIKLERAYHKAKSEGLVGIKKVSIPIMITNQMRFQLSTLGYTKDEMKYLTPEKAWDIIKKNIPKKPSRERGRNQ